LSVECFRFSAVFGYLLSTIMAAVDAAALMPIPAGYEVVGKHVPAAAHWRSLNSRPDNFDADSVWTYTHGRRREKRCTFHRQ
jgi:hypothetical protein